MAEVTDVTITAGVPTAGSGTVPTISKLMGSVATGSTLTRTTGTGATTQYAAGDAILQSQTLGSCTPGTFTWNGTTYYYLLEARGTYTPASGETFIPYFEIRNGNVVGARMKKSATSLTSASFRVHVHAASPTIAAADNSAISNDWASYLGAIDIIMDKAFTDAAFGRGTPNSAEPMALA